MNTSIAFNDYAPNQIHPIENDYKLRPPHRSSGFIGQVKREIPNHFG